MNIETLKMIAILVAILSNVGVFSIIGYFLKRLMEALDAKASKVEVGKLEDLINENFAEDKERDKKLDSLIASVNELIFQMKTVNQPTKCANHNDQIGELRREIAVHEVRITNLENK
jgi:arginine deiminase